MNTRITAATLLAIALAATTFAQTPARPAPARPGAPVRSAAPASRPGVAPSVSRPSFPPTAKSDDLVESPATNVVKGAFGYTLGAIWEEAIPKDAEPDKDGEIVIPVEPKTALPPFETITLSISTNEYRIAAIFAKTPRMMLAESYTETLEKANEIARALIDNLDISNYVQGGLTNISFGYGRSAEVVERVMAGKLYREFLKNHPTDPDYSLYTNHNVWLYIPRATGSFTLHTPVRTIIQLVAGSRYNEKRAYDDHGRGKPDYLQTIEQPFDLNGTYYPYAGEAVIRFSVRDVEDRSEHTNLVSVADLKKAKEEESQKTEKGKTPPPSIVRQVPKSSTEHGTSTARAVRPAIRVPGAISTKKELTPEEQAFKDSLYRLSFAEAAEKVKDNDPEALLRIALAYSDDKDIQRDSDKAREYLEKACKQNYGYAQYVYGLFYWHYRSGDKLSRFGLGAVISPVSLDGDKATSYFEQAISNGVSFAQEDLDYVRGKLKAQAEDNARKEKNAELLKGAAKEKSQEEETPADTYAEPETHPPQPARRTAPVRPARPAGDATNAPARAPARSAAATVTSPARPAIRAAAQRPAGEPKEQTAAENKTERDQAFVRIKETLRRMPFEEAAEKSKGKDSEALLRVAFAFAEGKEVSKSAGDAYNYVLDASRLDYGIAHYLLGVSAGASMFKAWEGSNYCCERNARWREIIDQIGWPEDVRLFPRFDLKRSAPMGFDGERVLIGYRRDRDVTEEQRLEREKELAKKAVSSFEKAVSNGVSIAQEDLDFMRKELVEVSKELDDYRAEEERRKKDKELSDELKRKNEALLKGEAE